MDYLLQKNYPLRINRQKTSKSQSIKYNNVPKGKKAQKFKYTPSLTTTGESSTKWGYDVKKYKSTNKTISFNNLPKIDSFLISNTINTTSNKGQFELFVRNKTSYYKNSDLKNENINDEQFGEIELLWDELGITDEYQDQFELYLGTINNSEGRQRFLMMEKNNLNKIKDALIKFSKEKKNRIKTIELLKQLNNIVKQNIKKGEKKISKELLKQIIECIKSVRLSSVNVVNNFVKVRESMTCFSIEDKINFEKIYQNYLFDNNYLLKINSDISFLKYSEIDKIFEKNNPDETLDTFLTLYNDIKKNENEKISNPMSKDLLNAIDKCRYYIMQDSFLNNVKTKKILKNNRNLTQKFNNKYKGYSLMTLSNVGSRGDYNPNFMDLKIHKLKSELGKDYNNLFINANKQNPSPNNKRYNNLIKNQGKRNKNSKIMIEKDNSPYIINTSDNSNVSFKNNDLDNINNYYVLQEEENKEEKEQNKRGKKYEEEVIHPKQDDLLDKEKDIKKDNVKDNISIKEELKVKEEEKKESNEKQGKNIDDDDKIIDMDLS